MNKYIMSIAVSSILTSALYATSIKDVVEQTIGANPDILSERFNKDAYKKYVDEEKGDYYPTIDFSGYLENSKTKYDLDDDSKEDGTKNGWNNSLTIEQILYDGGRTPSEVEEYRHKYYGNNYRSTQRVEEIIRGAIDSYMDLLMYQELMNLSENNLKLHDDYLVMAKDKESISGEILESYQVNSKKHYITDRYLEQKQLENEALNTYMRYTQTPTDGRICRPEINEALVPDTLDKAIKVANLRNFDILEQIESVKEQRENIIQAKANYLPTLRFQWKSTWDNDLEYDENGRYDIHSARLLLDWNLFEGGKTFHATQREKLFLKEQQKVLDNVVNEVREEVSTAYSAYNISKQRLSNLRKYVVDNRNIRDVYLKQLQDGTRTFIDILDAESDLYNSQVDALNQEMDVYAKYFDLLQKMGILSESIIKSKDQECKLFVPKKYINPIKKQNTNMDENMPLDEDVLKELGIESNLDMEINNIINKPHEENVAKEVSKNILPEGKYTINLATLDTKLEDINSFRIKYNLKDDKSLYSYNMGPNTRLLYGGYDNLEDAKKAILSLNAKGIKSNAYVDYLDKYREQAKENKIIN